MSLKLIRQALETRLNALGLPVGTVAWENVEFTPTSGTMFQKVSLMPSETVSLNKASTTELLREQGLLQVSVYGPLNKGMKDVYDRVELIRAQFPKGLTVTAGGVNVTISKRASVAPAMRDGEWIVVPVSIPYFANIYV